MTAAIQEVSSAPASARRPAVPRPALVSLMGATFDTGNLGVSALASGAIAAIRHGLPQARIFLLDYGAQPVVWTDPVGGEPVSVELCNLRFSRRAWLPNHIARLLFLALLIRMVPGRARRNRLARRSAWLRRIAAADFHLSLAGGDSFSDSYGLRRLCYMALPQVLVLLLERPLVLLPQTYGPFRTRTARVIARWILRRASLVYSRDREGLTVIRGLLGHRGPEPLLAHDLGFALEPLPPRPAVTRRLGTFRQGGPLVGCNVSGLLHIGGYSGANMFGLKSDYRQLMGALLDRFIAGHGARVLLIPHVHGEGENSESDLAACRQIARQFQPRYPGLLDTIDETFDHHETKHLIGGCDFFVGSRMHACIAALSQFVPTVGLAYSRKFAGVMEAAGAGAVVVDLRALGLAEVVARVDAAWDGRAEMRRQLLERIPAIQQSVSGLLRRPEFTEFLRHTLP